MSRRTAPCRQGICSLGKPLEPMKSPTLLRGDSIHGRSLVLVVACLILCLYLLVYLAPRLS